MDEARPAMSIEPAELTEIAEDPDPDPEDPPSAPAGDATATAVILSRSTLAAALVFAATDFLATLAALVSSFIQVPSASKLVLTAAAVLAALAGCVTTNVSLYVACFAANARRDAFSTQSEIE